MVNIHVLFEMQLSFPQEVSVTPVPCDCLLLSAAASLQMLSFSTVPFLASALSVAISHHGLPCLQSPGTAASMRQSSKEAPRSLLCIPAASAWTAMAESMVCLVAHLCVGQARFSGMVV